MKITEILRNQHLKQFAAILSIAQAPGWRMAHPEIPSVRDRLDGHFIRLIKLLSPSAADIQQTFLIEFSQMIIGIVNADPKLHYAEDDYEWLVSAVESEDAQLTLSLLLVSSITNQRWFTADELATFTDRKPSTWRNLGASGAIIGAKKAGTTWIFPELALQAYGVQVPSSMQFEVEYENAANVRQEEGE